MKRGIVDLLASLNHAPCEKEVSLFGPLARKGKRKRGSTVAFNTAVKKRAAKRGGL